MTGIMLSLISTCGDVFDTLYAYIWSCYYQAFPLIRMKQKSATHAPWVTAGLRTATKGKNKLYQSSLRHPTALDITEYANCRNKLTQLLRKQHRNYHDALMKVKITKTSNVTKSRINNKNIMPKYGNFVNNNIAISDDLEIANHIKKYSVRIGPNLAKVTTITQNEFRSDTCNKIM